MKTIFSLIFLMHIGQVFSQNRATTLYVDYSYTGTTVSDGSEAFPFTTIRQALDYRGNVLGISGMVSNEEIVVKAGTYSPGPSEMIFLTAANGGKDDYWFILRAEGDVYLDGANLYTQKFAALIAITAGAENVKVQGFKLNNLRNNQSLTSTVNGVLVKDGKFGIQIANTVRNVQIIDNEIYDFSWTLDVDPMKNRLNFTPAEIAILQSAEPGDNSGAINIVGTDIVPISGLVVKNNYIHNVIPGWTEGIQINGNVDGFEVSNNIITEVQNIGIVAAGHYTWVPEIEGATVTAALNYARNGVIKNNKVSSCRSPIAAAAGIYCDGSQNIIVENNTASDGQVGFSIGNENSNVNSGGHTLRNNLSYSNAWAGIVIGVPAAATGTYIDGVSVTGNSVFRNGGITDTYLGYMGASELIIQKNIQNLNVENNIFYADGHNILVSFAMPFDSDKTAYINTISFDYNHYFTNSTETTPLGVFDWSQLGSGYDYYGTFDWYRVNRTDQDVHSSFTDPDFESTSISSINLNVKAGSPVIDSGNPAYAVSANETDYIGNDRISGNQIDKGAYESGASAAGDEAAAIDGIKSSSENYLALQTGVTQGVWKNIYAYDDANFIYVYAEYAGSLPEYSVFVNTDSSTGFQETWPEKTNYYVDGTLKLLNSYDENGNSQWPYKANNEVMNINFIETTTAIEGRIPKDAIGLGDTGTIGLGIIGYTQNWPTSVGAIPTDGNAMVYLTLDGGSEAGSLSVDGYKSPVEKYQPLITGVTGSSFSSIYGYTDNEYIYLYAALSAPDLSEYNVYINTNGATGFQYFWTDKSDYFIDANYNVLNEHNSGNAGWPFSKATNSTGIEFIMTATGVEGKILKSLLGLGNSGTIGIGLEGHTKNWKASLGTVPTNSSMVYLSLGSEASGTSLKASIAMEESVVPDIQITPALKVYPNPATNYVYAAFSIQENEKVLFEILGVDGRTYYASETSLKRGNQNYLIPIETLGKGIYLLRVKSSRGTEVKKIVIN